jgi:TrmH family RNA methyltransferase
MVSALSARNPKVQRLRRLARQRSYREAERAFVIEGVKLVEEALAEGVAVDEVFTSVAGDLERYAEAGASPYLVDGDVLDRVLDTVSSQGVAAIAPRQPAALDDALLGGAPLLVLVGLNDPGNAGTLLRAAEAAGCGAVVFCEGSVDPFAPKCVRASAGSIFRVPVASEGEAGRVLEWLGDRSVRRLGTSAHGGVAYDAAALHGPFALVLGSEARGLPPEVEASIDDLVHIPMAGRAESLNVAVAGAVVLFEAARQRRHIAAGGS